MGEELRGDAAPHAFTEAELVRLATYREAVRSGFFNDRGEGGPAAPPPRGPEAFDPARPIDPAFGL